MTKAELRKKYKDFRKTITVQQRAKWTDLILINFQKIHIPPISYLHTYLPIENQGEIDTQYIIRYLRFINPSLVVCAPKINSDTASMDHFIYNKSVELLVNRFGIPEPVGSEYVPISNIDLVLIPLLAFDKRGNRVGYGKGFYDKFLEQCNPGSLKIGLSYFEAEEAIDDIGQFDIPLNFCITPQTIYSF